MADRKRGTVKWFNNSKGFGFIAIDGETGQDVFVHFKNIKNNGGYRTLQDGQQVEFTVTQGPKGAQAEDVTILE